MRRPEYLSHTARQLWETNRSEFYMKYLCDQRSPRQPQNHAMCVGAAFDAFVKASLHYDLFHHDGNGEFERSAIFEQQVEPHNWDFGYAAGEHVFTAYKRSGAYDRLLTMLQTSREAPRFEFTVKGKVDGIPLLGKPDCRFVHRSGVHVVLDWKCKGYCSKHTTSPTQGYALVRDGFNGKKSRNDGKSHRKYTAFDMNGLEVNQRYMEEFKQEYAEQLAMYGWLMGEPIGDESVAFMIDEIVGKYTGPETLPLLRVASHRARVKSSFQTELLNRYRHMWKAIQDGHIFNNMSRDDSDEQIEILDRVAESLVPGDYFTECTRGDTYRG